MKDDILFRKSENENNDFRHISEDGRIILKPIENG
jgi:hypothetical protein